MYLINMDTKTNDHEARIMKIVNHTPIIIPLDAIEDSSDIYPSSSCKSEYSSSSLESVKQKSASEIKLDLEYNFKCYLETIAIINNCVTELTSLDKEMIKKWHTQKLNSIAIELKRLTQKITSNCAP